MGKGKVILWGLLLICFLSGVVLAQDDPFDEIDRIFDEKIEEQDASYQDYLDRQDATWRAYVAQIEAKWNEFEDSDKKKWVDYDQVKDTKSRVEFEEGYVEIEVVVPKNSPNTQEQAQQLAANQLRQIFSDQNAANQNVLADMIQRDDGQIVDQQNLDNYIQREVVPQVRRVDPNFQSKDGVLRERFSIRVPMVTNHSKKRAQRYLPTVKVYCQKYELDVAFVLALMHTESHFNPLAKSPADAYGLMQLIPRYGAKEAYEQLYSEKKRVSPDYLYNPENNILLGTTYLHLLMTRYFGFLNDDLKRRHCSIAGYNWGPGRVKKKVNKSMSEAQIYAKIKSIAPKETRDYLDRITARIPQYRTIVD